MELKMNDSNDKFEEKYECLLLAIKEINENIRKKILKRSQEIFEKRNTIKKNNEEIALIPLSKWDKYFDFPSKGTMRNICSIEGRKENGVEDFLTLINGRFYIKIKKFREYIENKKI